MLLDRLIAYYGVCGDEESAFISKRIGQYTETAQEELFNVITQDNGKRYGFPDLQKLYKAFQQVSPDGKGTGPKIYYWLKCRKCGCEFWGDLSFCPKCHDNGIANMECDAIKSSVPPTDNVVRFNLKGRTPVNHEKVCYNCESRYGSYCYFFGDGSYDCHRRHECPCNECCMRAIER